MKKFVCIFMTSILSMLIAIPSLAAETTENNSSNDTYDKNTVSEITEIEDGIFLYSNSDGTEYITGGVNVNLASSRSVNDILQNPKLENEVKEKVAKMSMLAKETNSPIGCTVYSPELLPVTSDIQPYATINKYYTYNGTRMKSEIVTLTNLNTGWKTIGQGKNASTIADGITNIVLTVAGLASKTVSIVSAGKTVLDFFIDAFGTKYISGSTQDFFQMEVIYDDSSQWTYREFVEGTEDWRLGLCTQKVNIKDVATNQYYFTQGVGGETHEKHVFMNVEYKSPSYNSPWAKAYQWIIDPQAEWLSWKVGSYTYMF